MKCLIDVYQTTINKLFAFEENPTKLVSTKDDSSGRPPFVANHLLNRAFSHPLLSNISWTVSFVQSEVASLPAFHNLEMQR